MLGFIRLLIALLAMLFAFGIRRAGFTYLIPLGFALAIGWPFSRLTTASRRPYVFALAVLAVHSLWILYSAVLCYADFDIPVLGSLFRSLTEDGEMLETGFLGAWYFDLDWMSPMPGSLVGATCFFMLGFLLLGTDSPWPRYLACAILALLALRVALIIKHDGLSNTPASIFAHLLLRLTALGLLLAGILAESTARIRAAALSSVDPERIA